jgi:hypothetical protein
MRSYDLQLRSGVRCAEVLQGPWYTSARIGHARLIDQPRRAKLAIAAGVFRPCSDNPVPRCAAQSCNIGPTGKTGQTTKHEHTGLSESINLRA